MTAEADDDEGQDRGCCGRFGEFLVPDGTFGDGPKANRSLLCARVCLFLIYALIAFIFFGTIALLFVGRVEIVDHRMKFDRLEAPSVAICPWLSNTSVEVHPSASYIVEAYKFGVNGRKKLQNKPRKCVYDRVCYCLELFDVKLEDVDDSHHSNSDGQYSEEMMTFRERIEIHTTLRDPSSQHTLKYGFFDEQDHRPSWYYAPQFHFVIGQLRLDSWMVSPDHDTRTLWQMLKGDMHELRRHFYSYIYSETDSSMDVDEQHQQYTRLSYEFRTFFVVETISSTKAYGVFTLISMIILLAALSNIMLLFEWLFPPHAENKVQKRSVAGPLQCLCQKLFKEDLTPDNSPKAKERDPSYGTV
eukprot:gnl/TRDRNA2_/TRDRNA2_147602_c0_seq1.p1 gnl/TRDRNA2_/TRDRNA2_147602_c0~~gnl/TRDRNA2_/TRDRNA2_147602_c0_seq1.p1  ORF type:complete len:359 (+),score=56.70 gnl/TRDRNA2_/TRDRNA2_147602_c0_seq1:96-1172(+)